MTRHIRSAALALAAVAILTLSACSDPSVDEAGKDKALSIIHERNLAKPYDNETVASMVDQTCSTLYSTGDFDRAVGVLDNYSKLSHDERQAIAAISRSYACQSR